ncbi:fumarylacetoacetate hydrolase family protein [Rhabdobacter roseus]|uniref:2-keto-4-pentenoate hydratase/2-oxohepta-3-ene-1,7-dioic acid hydratase in catechol pathway n=1 Tax=Rhabdobacter roseus TaxID=1655419 RepID=A0A840TPN7_9BACT|nr:fumarylacetoacetate hydrolase family protein [Rhabdobacter roseus]MBB5286286.1 2-keto-4-pentenoate hydratase/2-oxohepta-3-ene-1,7-dioic acid hydratase in catechol pathway [Rhabdobacter roseus]
MKLIRFGAYEQEKPGVLLPDGTMIDVSAFGEDYNEKFFATDGLNRLADWLTTNADASPVVEEGVRLGSCVARPSKIICIGLNYAKHAAESGAEPPKEPVIFFKSTTALCGPNDRVIIPRNSVKTDWEVELAVVIGRRASYITEAEALDYVAGYALHNDYSEREFQLERSGQWVKGKSNDTFAPLGPYLATKDEVPDPHNLRLWLSINGQTLQDSNTSDMIFYIPKIVSYLSQFMTLLPGDVISTGTPAGVGLGLKPPVYLKPGDVVELGIEGLGEQRQVAEAWKP